MQGSLVIDFLQLGFSSRPAGIFILIDIFRVKGLVRETRDGAGVLFIGCTVRFTFAIDGDAADGGRTAANGRGPVPILDGQGAGIDGGAGRGLTVGVSLCDCRTFSSGFVSNLAAITSSFSMVVESMFRSLFKETLIAPFLQKC